MIDDTNKSKIWEAIISDIESEINANRKVIPESRMSDIQHYLAHDEYGMAFEYLYLEIMEREDSRFELGSDRAVELAIFFKLDNEDECMIDPEFWVKLQEYIRVC